MSTMTNVTTSYSKKGVAKIHVVFLPLSPLPQTVGAVLPVVWDALGLLNSPLVLAVVARADLHGMDNFAVVPVWRSLAQQNLKIKEMTKS